MYRFLENFETGIPFIDNGHRRLLEDMEEAREALAAGHEDEYHRLRGQLLETMQDHIVKQHVYEEEIMVMSHDAELDGQKADHVRFRDIIDRHKSSMNFQSDHDDLTALMNFLNEWFLQHILSSDMLIGSALRKAKAAAVKAKAQAAKEARKAETAQTVRKEPAVEEPKTSATQPTEAADKPAAPAKKTTKKRTAAKKQPTAAEDSGKNAKDSASPTEAAKPAKKPRKTAGKKQPAEKTAAAAEQSAPIAEATAKPAAPVAETAAKPAAPKASKPTTPVITSKQAPAAPFALTDEVRTQIPLVDKEHETLFKLVRQTYDLVHDEFCVDKFDNIVAILEELRNYTIKHFADEERYMKSINYDGLAEQVAAHTAFVEQLNNLDLDEIDRNQEGALDDLIKFLLNWLVQHILKVDKKMPYIEEAALNLTE